jgi:hypothetical protein
MSDVFTEVIVNVTHQQRLDGCGAYCMFLIKIDLISYQ